MSNAKHIVIDARIRLSSTGRPIERFLHYLPTLDKKNHYSVLVDPGDKVTFHAPNIKKVVCKYKRFSMNPFEQVGFALQLYRLKPDLVFYGQTGLTPLLYFGKNVTLTHDLTMLRYARAGKLPQWLHVLRMYGYRLLFWKGNITATKIITPTNWVANDLKKYSNKLKSKTVVCYEAGILPVKDKSQKLNNSRLVGPFILHTGSPFPHKNINNLVLAFEILKKDFPDLQLVLSGKKEHYFEQLEKWLEGREYAKDIIITGYTSDAELKWLMENAKAYVLPSLSEGFSCPGLEAMANGCPLVSSDATCLPEVYGEAALYFNPDDPKDIATATKSVLDSEKTRKELIIKGYTQTNKYSWEKMSKEIYKVLESSV